VWVGYAEAQLPLVGVEGYSAVFGGTIPALIWHDFMVEAMEGMRVRAFPEPSTEGYTVSPPTPVPAPSPSPSPTESPEPEPTDEPSPSPTVEPSPTPLPSPTPTETPLPTPTATPSVPPPGDDPGG
jgi:membrane peptidoglycan carboxypeptidase